MGTCCPPAPPRCARIYFALDTGAFASASSALKASPGRAAFIKASPIKKAPYPAARIRTIRPRLQKLKLIQDEILAQAGKPGARRSLSQIDQRSLKKIFVGQHRKRSRSGLFQLPRQLFRIKIASDQSSRRRRLFQLRNDRDARSGRVFECPAESARDVRRRPFLQLAHVGLRATL